MNVKNEVDLSLSIGSLTEVRRHAIMFELNALRTRRNSLLDEVQGMRGEVQRLQQESSRREFEWTSCADREQQLTAESAQLAVSNEILAEVRRKAIRFELAALRNRRHNLAQKAKDIKDELHRLHAECARKEAERAGILKREEQLAQELEQLTDSSNICQSPQAVRENSGDRIAPAVVVRVSVTSEPLPEPEASANAPAPDYLTAAKAEESFEEMLIVNGAAAIDAVTQASAEWSHTSTRDGFEDEAPEDGPGNGDEPTKELLQSQALSTPSPNALEAQSPHGETTQKSAKAHLKKTTKCREIGAAEFRRYIKAFGCRSDKHSTTYKCPVCNAMSTCKKYKRHLLLHLEDKSILPFKCPQGGCSQTFERRDYVQRHVKKVHGLDWTEGMASACINKMSKNLKSTLATK